MARYTKTGTPNTIGQLNSELDNIATAINDTLSRKGDSPNQLETDLDINSNRILNLLKPLNENEPARLKDINALTGLSSTPLNTGELILSSLNVVVGTIVETTGYTATDTYGAKWIKTAVTGTASKSPTELGLPSLQDANGFKWDLVYEYTIKLEKLGFVSNTIFERTALIQGLSDNLTNVELKSPSGTFNFGASQLVETWTRESGGTIDASGCCIVFRKTIRYSGQGRDWTTWGSSNSTLSIGYIDNGSNMTIQDLWIKNVYTGTENGAGHGLFQLVKNTADVVRNLNLIRLRLTNHASYAIGLQYGTHIDCNAHDIQIDTVGADGIDIKSRATNGLASTENYITKLRVRNFGLRLDGQVGLDVRGQYIIDNCWFTDFGDGTKSFVGLRLRQLSDLNNICEKTTATNIHVKATADGGVVQDLTVGIRVSGNYNIVTGFSVEGCNIGFNVQSSQGCVVANGQIADSKLNAIQTTVSDVDLTLDNIHAINTTGSAHFRIEGAGTTARSLSGDSSAEVYSLSTLADGSITRDIAKSREQDAFDFNLITTGRVGMRAVGPSTNIDIALIPKGSGGKLRLGENEALSGEVVTSYIKIKDSSGVERKIAVVS